MLRVNLADNPYNREKGLMFVEDLPEDKGMLFLFDTPQHLSFWGKNTFIPLDIAFVNDDNNIVKISSIQPHDLSGVHSDVPCIGAIEANEGYFELNNISVGDNVSLDQERFEKAGFVSNDIDWDGYVIIFNKNNKEISKDIHNIKQGQSAFSDVFVGQDTPEKVNKQDEETVGQPIVENETGKNLPVLDTSILGEILEDSFDEEDKEFSDVPVEEVEEPEVKEELPQPEVEQIVEKEEKKFPVFSNPFEATEWAKDNNEVIRINYTTKHGRSLVRDVEPHGHFHSDSSKREVLVTYDRTPGIDNIRAFLIGNISRWAFVGQKFEKKFLVKS